MTRRVDASSTTSGKTLDKHMDILIHGGILVTMDASRRIIDEGAVLIRGDRIVNIDHSDQLTARYPDAFRISAKDKLVLPGLINVHTHLVYTLYRGDWEDTPYRTYGFRDSRFVRTMTPEQSQPLALLGALEALKSGVTTVVEQSFNVSNYAQIFPRLGLRTVLAELVFDARPEPIARGKQQFDPGVGEATLTKGVDLIEKWHGHSDGRIRCMLGPHANDTVSPDLFCKVRDLAEQLDVSIFYHLSESQSQVDYILETQGGKRPVEFLAGLGFLGPRVVAGHCIYVNEREVELLGETGTNVAHNAAFNARRGRVAPIPSMIRHGVNVALGTDNMSSDMFEVMRVGLMVSRIREEDSTWPTPQDYLEMATINGAKALRMDSEIGSLEVGKKADITMIDLDRLHLRPLINPVASLVHYGTASDVDTVIVDGRILVQAGIIVGVEEKEVLEAAQVATDLVRARFDSVC